MATYALLKHFWYLCEDETKLDETSGDITIEKGALSQLSPNAILLQLDEDLKLINLSFHESQLVKKLVKKIQTVQLTRFHNEE